MVVRLVEGDIGVIIGLVLVIFGFVELVNAKSNEPCDGQQHAILFGLAGDHVANVLGGGPGNQVKVDGDVDEEGPWVDVTWAEVDVIFPEASLLESRVEFVTVFVPKVEPIEEC